MSVYLPSSGSSSIKLLVSNNISTNTYPSVVTPYLLGTACLTGTVEFYGDSITVGLNLPSPSTQRFSHLLAAQYGFTELNTAVSGDMIQDMLTKIYNNHVAGRTCVVKIGYNDCYSANYTDTNMYMIYDTFMAQMLYLCLSSSQLVNNRTGTTQTGAWTASSGSFTNGGSYTATNGATATAQVTGRYVGFFFTTVSTVANCSVTIDGGTAVPVSTYYPPYTTNGVGYGSLAYFYDTGVSGASHTILVTNTQATNLDIEFFFGFDTLSSASNSSVIVMGLEPATFQLTSVGSLSRQTLINNFQYGIVKMLRQTYGAKITFCYSIPHFSWANKLGDNIHPDVHGHARLKNTVVNTLTTGEWIPYT